MDNRIIKKMLRGTMIVMVVTVLSTMLGMLVDGIVIGRYLGQSYMSAYGLANPIFNLLIAINGVLAAGIQVLCSKYIGSADFTKAKQVHTISFITAGVIAVVLLLVMFFGGDQIAMLLGATGKDAYLRPEAADYIKSLGLGVPALMLAFITNSFMQIDSDQKRTIVAVVVMTVANITGDFINALVIHGGLFEMGMATTISYYIALFIALTHYLKKDNVLTFKFKGLKIKDALQVMKLGAPSGVVNLCITLRNIVMNRLLLLVATPLAVAAFSIQNTLTAATGAISTGLGMAVLLVSGIVAGEKDRSSAINLIKIMNKWGLFIALCEMAVCLIFATPLAGIFAGSDRALLEESAYCVRIYAFGFVGNVLNSMMENYVQGMGRVALANLLVVLDTFVYSVIVAWVLGFGFSLPLGYIWAAWAIGEGMVLLTTFFLAWKKQGHFPRRAADYSFFPKGFTEPKDSIDRTVYRFEELADMGMAVEKFCLKHGSGDKLAKKIHLCLEEMGANIINHGFSDGKEHSIDVRVIRTDAGFMIRMRDDCKSFDPKKWYEIHNPVDITRNIGIRLVFAIAKDVQYVNTMQLNNLVIELGES